MSEQRRYDLDWLRVLVFGLLIFYHIGMFFVPWGWHLKNDTIYEWLQLPMLFLNQWRLPVLFLISGMGTRFALSRRSSRQFIVERHNRLVIPLIFGMVVIIAPQVYVERAAAGLYSNFWEFYPHYFDGIYPSGNFSWHHLWFLPYLFVYSVLLSPIFLHLRAKPTSRLIQFAERMFASQFGYLIFLVPLLLVFFFLASFFPTTHNLIADWYNFTFSMILFFYGYLFVSVGSAFWQKVEDIRRKALIAGIVIFPVYVFSIIGMEDTIWSWALESITKMINLGAWIVVVFGYGKKYLSKPGKWLAYANQAVYPFYIFHQTIILIAAYYLYDSSINDVVKFIMLVLITGLGCWGLFELVKRTKLTRALFGIKPLR